MCSKKCAGVQTSLMLGIYMLFLLAVWLPSTALATSLVSCNCTRFEECEALKLLPSNRERHDSAAVAVQTKGEACGFERDSDTPLFCCSGTTAKRRKSRPKKRTIRSRPAYQTGSEYSWILDRRPYIPITEESQEDEPPVQNRFAGIRDSHQLNDPFHFEPNVLDYKDAKSLRNCPQPFYEEGGDSLMDHTPHHHHHYHQFHVGHGRDAAMARHNLHSSSSSSEEDIFDAPIVYPDDKRFDRPIFFPGPYSRHGVMPQGAFGARPKRPKPQSPPSSATGKDSIKAATTLASINSPQCGVSVGTRIFGGMPSSPSQFPWVTRIAYLNKTSNRISYRCSGSMISDVYVLTAAHCVINLVKVLQLSHVRIGDMAVTVDCQNDSDCEMVNSYSILDVIVHPNYDQPKYANDIALLKILRPPGTAATICLPIDNSANLVDRLIGSTGVVAGWSTNREGIETPVNATVKFLRLPIVNNTECAITYGKYSENFNDPIVITPSQLCAQGQPMNDVCRGDSGGPFMDDGTSGLISSNGRYTLLGIVAFGPTMCGVLNFPGVYTRVSSYTQWIADNIS